MNLRTRGCVKAWVEFLFIESFLGESSVEMNTKRDNGFTENCRTISWMRMNEVYSTESLTQQSVELSLRNILIMNTENGFGNNTI